MIATSSKSKEIGPKSGGNGSLGFGIRDLLNRNVIQCPKADVLLLSPCPGPLGNSKGYQAAETVTTT